MLIDRPPITEGWHLLLMLAVGVVAVAVIHRVVRRRVAAARRASGTGESDEP
jgi:hypothetical protein